MNTNHTPGPWIIHKSKFTFAVSSETEPHAGLVAHLYAKGDPSADAVGFSRPEEAQANARLIAAAPLMLQTLRETLAQLEAPPMEDPAFIVNGGQVPQYTLSSLRQAIAKAEGKS